VGRLRALGTILLFLQATLSGEAFTWLTDTKTAIPATEPAGKLLLLYWVAGPSAAVFAQELERAFAPWPQWRRELSTQLTALRLRSWENRLPMGLPPLPGNGTTNVLALGRTGDTDWLATWTEVPPVLELSHAAVELAGLSLAEPYGLEVTEFDLPKLSSPTFQRSFVRQNKGPYWIETLEDGTRTWKEEGPVGSLLVLRDSNSSLKAAFPLVNDWCFLYNPVAQSWSPWSQVLVKNR